MYIGEAARRCGLSIDTIRYYETLGLLASGSRDSAGRRVFQADDVRWLVFLRTMRETQMPLADLREYLRHRDAGADGVPGLIAVLRRHRETIRHQQAQLTDCAALIDTRILKYQHLSATGQAPGRPEVDLE
jgi:DNA-binding transcriptional MerR regulator